MGLFSRVVKGADEPADDHPGRRTMHGSNPGWVIAAHKNTVMTVMAKPKPAPTSRTTDRPGRKRWL